MELPRRPAPRLEVHNVSVDEQVADAGGCAQLHLASGRICRLPYGHSGTCTFVPRAEEREQRAADAEG
jgi:hypothetical protein